jgi:adenosine kinase
VGANIAFGLGCLGLTPILVGGVGEDFAVYRSWLERHNVDTESVLVSDVHHTARFVCTTDADHNQIASFYTGAMSDARAIELRPVAERVGRLDLVVIAANDPEAMLRHSDECRLRGYPFAADPSQQLARMGGPDIRLLVDGAAYLFSNEYEAALTEQKTGWSAGDLLERVGVRITTLGSAGARVERLGERPIVVGCPVEKAKVDPTGVGDAFRAGFLATVAWGLGYERAAQVGAMLATYVVETVGTQEYELSQLDFLGRFADAYGMDAAAEIEPSIRTPRP